MKYLFVVFFLMVTSTANAQYYYLVDNQNNVRCKQNGAASPENLEKDGFIQIESSDDIDLFDAEYRNGKIVKRVMTQKEIKEKEDLDEQQKEIDLINNKMRKLACETLKAEGKVFKHTKCEDFINKGE